MSEYDNTNRGSLFKNGKKETDKHPDYTGKINVGGTDFYLSSWIKESKAGEKYMSLSVKAIEQKDVSAAKAKPVADLDDDVPF
jgi:uncharacterized protein (DUF736 family)